MEAVEWVSAFLVGGWVFCLFFLFSDSVLSVFGSLWFFIFGFLGFAYLVFLGAWDGVGAFRSWREMVSRWVDTFFLI